MGRLSGLSMPQPQAPLAFAFGEGYRCPDGSSGRRDDLPLGAERRIGRVAPRAPGRRSWCAEAKRHVEMMAPATLCVTSDLSKGSLK